MHVHVFEDLLLQQLLYIFVSVCDAELIYFFLIYV